MQTQTQHDRSALRWIRGELDQTLRQARHALEDFVEGQQERLQDGIDSLHHAHGVLEMVQVYGGAMLADELEQLASAMATGQVKRPEAAAEAMMLGLVQLPAYLERVELGGADVPMALLPLMNDLRSAREAPLVSETSLFAPKLDALVASETVRPGSGNRELPQLIHHHRSHFHRGLLGWIKGVNEKSSLRHMHDVLDVLNAAAGTARLRRLLDAAEALTVVLMEDEEVPALAVRPLFGKLDRVFKQIIDQGEEAAMLAFPVDLLKNLLYYVARSGSTDSRVVAVRHAADLVNSFPEEATVDLTGSIGGPDREMFEAVGEALADDLRSVKDQLDLYMRSDKRDPERVTSLAQPIQRIADTLGMIGRGELRTRLKHRCDELRAAESSVQAPDEEQLLTLAGDLLFVESSLSDLGNDLQSTSVPVDSVDGDSQIVSAGEVQAHLRAAVDEAMVEMAQTKESILQYLDNPTETGLLDGVPARLTTVAGVLQLLEMPQAGRLLTALKPFIQQMAKGLRGAPDQTQSDALADVVIGAECYMQTALEPSDDRDRILGYAEDALAKLDLDQVEAVATEAQAEPQAEESAEPSVDTGPAEAADQAQPDTGSVADAPVAVASVAERMAGVPQAAGPAPVVDTEPMPDTESLVEQPVGHEVAAAAGDEAADGSGVDVIDAEILEVFQEEAEEELASIQLEYPKWRADQQDQESLTTLRRSFHTLKGSGRLVGAEKIGEFAWSIENLLNRVIDGACARSDQLFEVLDETVAVLPALVDESVRPGVAPTDVSALEAKAFALAAGEALTDEVTDLPVEAEQAEIVEAASAASADESDEPASATDTALESQPEPEPEPETEAGRDLDRISLPSFDLEPLDEGQALATGAVAGALSGGLSAKAPLDDDLAPMESLTAAGDDSAFVSPPLDADAADQPAGDDAARVSAETPSEPDLDTQPDESILSMEEVADSEFSPQESVVSSGLGSSLSAVFLSEVKDHLGVLASFLAGVGESADQAIVEDSVRRAMHTLRGSANTAGIGHMAELAASLEEFSAVMLSRQRPLDSETLGLLSEGHDVLTVMAHAVDHPHVQVPASQDLRDRVRAMTQVVEAEEAAVVPEVAEVAEEAPDPELLEIFLEEARELQESLESDLSSWEREDELTAVGRLQRTLHTLKGGARLAGISAVGDVSHALESVFESVVERRVTGDRELKGLVRHATDALALDIDALAAGQSARHHPEFVERLENAAHGREWEPLEASDALLSPEVDTQFGSDSASAPSFGPSTAPEAGVTAEAVTPPVPDEPAADAVPSECPPEPVDAMEATPASPDADQTTVAGEGSEAAPLSEDLQASETFDEIEGDSALLTDSQMLTDSELLEDPGFLESPLPPASTAADAANIVNFPGSGAGSDEQGYVPRRPLPEPEPVQQGALERIRVPSDALDYMVNNAGEVSIYRARLEQQNNTFAFNLGELQQTIERLRGQLRGLELETEAQILSRHERDTDGRSDFDPLELDRYSTMQQLSRALSETVEDLSNLGQSLNDLNRDADTLLLQQSRVTNDLQDSLLRTRMVKFSSRAPRLERVVRQTGHSVGKQARLLVRGGGQDMDRAILERMMSPLEHLLRNAVSHGIEDADRRAELGKPAQGTITLELIREGSDVMLSLSDDGAGLDREKIRDKAVERGLIEADAVIENGDLYQLILQPGFSTATELSQVSGRGVGMDVVLTEVKQLGGTLEIDSEPGKGTRFEIRLPFTLAITEALLVTLGDEIYAVPHGSIDGVVRVSLDEIKAIYSGEQERFRYNDHDYTVRYLGNMLGTQQVQLGEAVKWLPLMLVHAGEHRVAIQVDSLLGNRQIVVKSVGAQLSTVRWFTGGTILADGKIAMILDVSSLARKDGAHQPVLVDPDQSAETKGVSVMVVDDSITVRKVTSRLLERHNMQVITAKDGVDAVTQLLEYRPDVMLLDIEMPRMDGFELARHMRSTPELEHIPIIMITSRTGDKHRQRASELGVSHYLGKPYQEAQLLEYIYTVLADSAL